MKKASYCYDIEQYPNFHCSVWINIDDDTDVKKFKITSRSTQPEIRDYYKFLTEGVKLGIGFNNLEYDYPMLHEFIENVQPGFSGDKINRYLKKFNDDIIGVENKRMNIVPNPHFTQIDLFKVHHYDNKAKTQSLKGLQFELEEKVVMETPIPFDKFVTTKEEEDLILKYNETDVRTTLNFFRLSKSEIQMRIDLSREFGINMLNMSDTSIGEAIMMKLYTDKTGVPKEYVRKTFYTKFSYEPLILPYIKFQTEQYDIVKRTFEESGYNVNDTKAIKFKAKIQNLNYEFGLGGIHASRKGTFKTNDDHVIIDADVAGYYPSIPLANNFYITQLGPVFLEILKYIVDTRRENKKLLKRFDIDPEVLASAITKSDGFKLSSNSIYGKSSDKYSKLFDIKYTYQTTINGQLSLLMLIEMLQLRLSYPFKVLQANTDGFTTLVDRRDEAVYYETAKEWEHLTKLDLEYVNYNKMFIRDVNNYIAQDDSSKIKAKGAYETVKSIGNKRVYHKDSSFRILPTAVQAYLFDDLSIEDVITEEQSIFPFLGRQKINKSFKAELRFYKNESIVENYHTVDLEKVARYYITKESSFGDQSGRIVKIDLATLSETNVHKNNYAKLMQIVEDDRVPNNIGYDFYIQEAYKLLDPFLRGEQNFNKH